LEIQGIEELGGELMRKHMSFIRHIISKETCQFCNYIFELAIEDDFRISREQEFICIVAIIMIIGFGNNFP
jgi:hypothetical protein